MFGIIAASIALAQLPSDLAQVNRIVMMGDSITQAGASPKGYVTLVAKTLKETYPNHPIEVINVGISGEKAPNMLARFKKDVLDNHPQIVTLSVGVNDVWHNFRDAKWSHRVATGDSGRGVPLADYVKDVETMIDLAQKANIRMILISPTLVYEDLDCAENKRLSEYIDAAEKLARRKRVGYLNLNKVFKQAVSAYQKVAGKSQLLLTGDGVHMNDAGNALMANQILKFLGVPIPDNVHP